MGRRKAAEPTPAPRRFLIQELPRTGYWRHWIGLFVDREDAADFAKSRVSGASFSLTDITDLPESIWARGEWAEVRDA